MPSFTPYAGFLIIGLLGLSGCGSGPASTNDDNGGDDGGRGDDGGAGDDGGGGVTDPIDPPSELNIATASESAFYYNSLLPEFSSVRDAAVADDATVFATMPTMGVVTYDGYMNLIIGNTSVSANVIGETTIQASFATNAVSGSATNFQGVATDEYDTNHVTNYEGTIAITDGDIFAGADGTTDLDIDISGQIDNGLNVFAVDGNLVGGFHGPNAEGLSALGSNSGIHGNITTTIDGATGTIAIATVSAVSP